MSNFATFFQKHQTDKKRQCFRNVVAPFFAKMHFRSKGGIAFLLPKFALGNFYSGKWSTFLTVCKYSFFN